MNDLIVKGLIASVYGISGVFLVLILFYFTTRALMAIAAKFPEKKDE
jgi:Na+-transporting methylmalonyl-CoA/oxaloacetate decarboxylase gamma subunit